MSHYKNTKLFNLTEYLLGRQLSLIFLSDPSGILIRTIKGKKKYFLTGHHIFLGGGFLTG